MFSYKNNNKEENVSFNSKLIKHNLKIVIENTGKNEANADEIIICDEEVSELDLLDSTKKQKQKQSKSSFGNDENISDVSDDDDNVEKKIEEVEAMDEEQDEIEFHVNLDKVPPRLQNTTLNEKIYINESLRIDPNPPEDLNFISDEDLQSLYKSLNVSEENFDVSGNIDSATLLSDSASFFKANDLFKKEALHLFGVDELSTNDIFDYFKEYKPLAVEWINDSSCNVIWKNEVHAANAIFRMSTIYDENSESFLKNDTSKLELDKNREEILKLDNEVLTRKRPPRGFKWRIAVKPIKGYNLFMRFVKKNVDRKPKHAESRSKYYQKYGNPNYGNIKGLISNSMRQKLKAEQLKDAMSDLVDENDTSVDAASLANDENNSARKLVSYDLDDYKEIRFQDLNEIEEFGIATDNFKKEKKIEKIIDFDKNNNERLKRKKMRLYADDLDSKNDSSSDDEYQTRKSKRSDNFDESFRRQNYSRNESSKTIKSRITGIKSDRPQSSHNRYKRDIYEKPRHRYEETKSNPNDLRNKLNKIHNS